MRSVSVWVWVLVLGCSDPATLVVQVKTDVVPGVQFFSVRTELFDVVPAPSDTAEQERTQVAAAFRGQDFLSVQRVAEFTGLTRGNLFLRVQLVDASGAPVVARTVSVALNESRAWPVGA